MAYQLKTRNGHNMYDMASLLQKSIRRADIDHASYAAYELFGNFHKYLWRRLIIISAEDCWGIITKEIIALHQAEEIAFGNRKGYDKDPIFVAKAVTLLCMARKNRDGCYVACNFMLPDRTLDPEVIKHPNFEELKKLEDSEIPAWVYDVHTLKGKRAGKTDLDMTVTEQQALEPKQYGFFDDASWENYYTMQREKGDCGDKEWAKFNEFKKGRTVNGNMEPLPEEPEAQGEMPKEDVSNKEEDFDPTLF